MTNDELLRALEAYVNESNARVASTYAGIAAWRKAHEVLPVEGCACVECNLARATAKPTTESLYIEAPPCVKDHEDE